MEWVVNATLRLLYLQERSGTHCIGGWVGPRASLDRYGKSRPHHDSILGPSILYRVQFIHSKRDVAMALLDCEFLDDDTL
jgi:hypothetical protein